MVRSNRHGQLRKKVSQKTKKRFEPEIFIDLDSDFASIKIAPGLLQWKRNLTQKKDLYFVKTKMEKSLRFRF